MSSASFSFDSTATVATVGSGNITTYNITPKIATPLVVNGNPAKLPTFIAGIGQPIKLLGAGAYLVFMRLIAQSGSSALYEGGEIVMGTSNAGTFGAPGDVGASLGGLFGLYQSSNVFHSAIVAPGLYYVNAFA